MEQCSRCRFWLNWDSEMTNLGECHRYPPRLAPAAEEPANAVWPLTAPDDWCGEFQILPTEARETPPPSEKTEGETGPAI